MTYPYEERMDALKAILNPETGDEKISLLLRFISEEKDLLSQLTPPQNRSQALDSAQRELDALSEQLPYTTSFSLGNSLSNRGTPLEQHTYTIPFFLGSSLADRDSSPDPESSFDTAPQPNLLNF